MRRLKGLAEFELRFFELSGFEMQPKKLRFKVSDLLVGMTLCAICCLAWVHTGDRLLAGVSYLVDRMRSWDIGISVLCYALFSLGFIGGWFSRRKQDAKPRLVLTGAVVAIINLGMYLIYDMGLAFVEHDAKERYLPLAEGMEILVEIRSSGLLLWFAGMLTAATFYSSWAFQGKWQPFVIGCAVAIWGVIMTMSFLFAAASL
ncbi:MAG: hypothetical protein KF688_02755 [Pirellulales bacterium]|nr:hypothetical protein [Pirellulales bacterium]